MQSKVALIILDGWGIGSDPKADAIQQASTPCYDHLVANYPNSQLVTYGEEVGLPEGQMGNSEVGHLNIGAGRVVYQDFTKINKAIRDREFKDNVELTRLLRKAEREDKTVHFIGLLSDGGVHSHIHHLYALIDAADTYAIDNVFIHAFLDGRDTPPNGSLGYISDLLDYSKGRQATLSSLVGRYYAMDRDKRWERTKIAYDLLTTGAGDYTDDVLATIQKRYDDGITDEFMDSIRTLPGTEGCIQSGDVVICFNFRTDRPRQITEALTQKNFHEEGMTKLDLDYSGFTRYDDEYRNVGVLFEKENLNQTLGEVLSNHGISQVRLAETEKYPHVTFFFNGGREEPFAGERRILAASPKVATYDMKPEMSAIELTDKLLQDIKTNHPAFVCINYANTDMVGHTGNFEAAVKAAETVDSCLSSVIPAAIDAGYQILIIADHGNSDTMVNPDGSAHTAHTTNPVPCIFVNDCSDYAFIQDGKLADIAPTILRLMGFSVPKEMTGDIIVKDS